MDTTDHNNNSNSAHDRSSEGAPVVVKQSTEELCGGTNNDPNIARSVQLQTEWGALRAELDALMTAMADAKDGAPAEDQVARKEALVARMTVITKEMTDILYRTQEKLPPTPSQPGYEAMASEGPPVRSKRGKHRVERTYDSSDDEGPPPDRVHPKILTPNNKDVGAKEEENETNNNSNGEKEQGPARVGIGKLGTKLLRSTLQKAQNSLGAGNNNITSSITEEEKEALKVEESRLEREMRALKREFPDGPPPDHTTAEKRMQEINKRLKEIADLSLDNAGSGGASPASLDDKKGEDTNNNSNTTAAGHLRAKARALATTLSGHGKEKSDDDESKTTERPKAKDGAGNGEGDGNNSNNNSLPTRKKSLMMKTQNSGKKAVHGLNKKWGKFSNAVKKKLPAKNKADGVAGGGASSSGATAPNNNTSTNNNGASASSTTPTTPTNNNNNKFNAGSPSTVQSTAGNNNSNNVHDEVNQTKQRLAERGDKLEGVANETAAMREDASDFLAAARALRKKNEKKGLFA